MAEIAPASGGNRGCLRVGLVTLLFVLFAVAVLILAGTIPPKALKPLVPTPTIVTFAVSTEVPTETATATSTPVVQTVVVNVEVVKVVTATPLPPTATRTATSTPTITPTPTATPVADVYMECSPAMCGFIPSVFHVRAGDTVTWINATEWSHDVSNQRDVVSGEIEPGGSYTHRFESEGTWVLFDYVGGFGYSIIVVGNPPMGVTQAPTSTGTPIATSTSTVMPTGTPMQSPSACPTGDYTQFYNCVKTRTASGH